MQKFLTDISIKNKRSRTRAIKLLKYIKYKNCNNDQINNLIKMAPFSDFKIDGIYITYRHFTKTKLQLVPLNSIVSSQPGVSVDVIIKKIGGKWPEHNPDTIELIYHEGLYYLHDGNHRVNKDKLLGKKFVKAKVVYADNIET